MPLPFAGQFLLAADDIEFVSDGTVTFELQASDEGSKLIFRNAILARAETNRNFDEIPSEEIDNLAATIAGCPIDLEHDPSVNVGVFTGGRAVDTPQGRALSVDGLIWADRYAAEAAGVRAGTHHLSVEASCASVTCSKCGQTFAGRQEYCPHLRAKRAHQARRTARGLKSVGGAVTQRPAGTATGFDRSQLFLVANHQEEDPMTECPRCHQMSASEDTCSHCGKAMSASVIAQELREAIDKLATTETRLSAAQGEVSTLTAAVETEKTGKGTVESQLSEAQAKVTEVEAAKVTVESELKATRETLRRHLLGTHVSDEQWSAQKDSVMAMTDAQFQLILGAYGARPAPQASGVHVPSQLKAGQTPVEL